VLERGCSALCNMASGDAHCKQQIVENDGIGGIVAVMRAHPRRANVQERGCAALCQMAAGNDECKAKVRDAPRREEATEREGGRERGTRTREGGSVRAVGRASERAASLV
jgi:hypothetical protein